ncbi:MAG: flagellar export protein FliJ [Gemmatimonadaceae bacterium]
MFRFRLQRVLELREQREKAEAVVLAEAERAAAEARTEREQLQAMHSNARANLSTAQRTEPTVGHLHHLGYVLSALDERITKASAVVTNTEGVVLEARKTLELAARDRRVMDRLKDKHQEVHNAEETQRDRVQMDEIALGRFTRNRVENSQVEHSREGDTEG